MSTTSNSLKEQIDLSRLVVGSRLKSAIQSSDLSFEEVQKASGIRRRRFFRLLDGDASLTMDELARIYFGMGIHLGTHLLFEDLFSSHGSGEGSEDDQ